MATFQKQRRTEPDEDDMRDGITFDKQGRMHYHPDFHPNHKTPFTLDELIYICKFYDIDGPRKMSFAIGRTELTCMNKICLLRKNGDYDRYKNMTEEMWLRVI